MSVDWSGFKSNMTEYFKNNGAKDASECAKKLATEYENAIKTAVTKTGNKILKTGNFIILENGFKLAFETMLKSPINLKLLPYTILASSIVAYWIPVSLNPLPPVPPTISPTTGFTLNFFGLPTPLDKGLQKAFNSGFENPVEVVVDNLILCLKVHMSTISGVYNGLIPAVPNPVPSSPIPFVGLF